ncbi:translation initiation factor IF-2-like isoform X4 [Panicum virgatum]|uniref:Uncharacterized protein n=1 Tax=Panicum virgatum TaxID=38727 RepID=A0A8T0PJG2_PANVG|nr:translation initiation factor IF-2-like isoform X4 [Panicum virgatum]KAG2558464.1 hypothetical protein PVAP13_8NG267705 [Panicum virgatum]
MENERQHLLYADQRGGGWRTPRSGVAACGGKRYRGWRCCAGTAAGASSRAGGACLPSLDPALARPDPAAVSSAPAPPRRARRGPPRVGSGVREAGSGGGELGACASTSSSARLLAPPPRRGWWAAVAARSGGTPSGGSRRRRRGALEPPRRPTPRSGPRRPLLALPQRGPHQRGRRRPHVGDCALPRSIPDTSSHPPRGAAFHRAPHWRGRPPPPTAFQKRRGRRRRGTMATAQAASASPTHHRVSPGTSPPQPPYPSASRIADSACFPQYTASLKCLEGNQDKSKCQQQFDNYKECKKKELGNTPQNLTPFSLTQSSRSPHFFANGSVPLVEEDDERGCGLRRTLNTCFKTFDVYIGAAGNQG